MHPAGPTIGHLDVGFHIYPMSLSKCWDGSKDSKLCFSRKP